MAHAEKLKAYITADWLINSDEITRRQIDARVQVRLPVQVARGAIGDALRRIRG